MEAAISAVATEAATATTNENASQQTASTSSRGKNKQLSMVECIKEKI